MCLLRGFGQNGVLSHQRDYSWWTDRGGLPKQPNKARHSFGHYPVSTHQRKECDYLPPRERKVHDTMRSADLRRWVFLLQSVHFSYIDWYNNELLQIQCFRISCNIANKEEEEEVFHITLFLITIVWSRKRGFITKDSSVSLWFHIYSGHENIYCI